MRTRLGRHARDRRGYLAGHDEDRLADLDAALRDPEVRAVVTLRGGCGSSRLVPGVDLDALVADPKPLVGYSDITPLHLLWRRAGVASVHGAPTGAHAELVREALTGVPLAPVARDREQYGSELTTAGCATGPLVGGNLEMLARSVGVVPFDLAGHVLLLEINRAAGLGMVDRALTQLLTSGSLDGVVGVAIGWLQGFEGYADRGWTVLDVLRDRLPVLDVPVLARLPLGHDPDPEPVLLGVPHRLDADAGTLAPG